MAGQCYTRSFLSGKEKELQREPRQSGGGMTSGAAARPTSTEGSSPSSCAALGNS